MAKRPIKDKQIRRLERAIRKDRLDSWINLIDYLRDRGYAQTAGQARKILTDGRVMVESHKVGRVQIDTPHGKQWMAYPYIHAQHRNRIVVN